MRKRHRERIAGTMSDSTFSLHPQLAADTVPAGDLPQCRVLLANDANYPWLILVPRQPGLSEIIDLPEGEHVRLLGEIRNVAHALRAVTNCDKLNIAAIGNLVPQLHIHIVARRRTDPAWPKPVWGTVPATAYTADARAQLIAALKRTLPLA